MADQVNVDNSEVGDYIAICDSSDRCDSSSDSTLDLNDYCNKEWVWSNNAEQLNESLAPNDTADEDEDEDNEYFLKSDTDISSAESDTSEYKPSSVESSDEASVHIAISPKKI